MHSVQNTRYRNDRIKIHLFLPVLSHSVYHKPRTGLHKRGIVPLTDTEYDTHLFQFPPTMGVFNDMYGYEYTLPDMRDFKQHHHQQAVYRPRLVDFSLVSITSKGVDVSVYVIIICYISTFL